MINPTKVPSIIARDGTVMVYATGVCGRITGVETDGETVLVEVWCDATGNKYWEDTLDLIEM